MFFSKEAFQSNILIDEAKKILTLITQFLIEKPLETNGFFNGKSGVSLYFFSHYLISKDKNSYDIAYNYLMSEMLNIENIKKDGHETDFQWFIWLLCRLKKDELLNINIGDFKSIYDLLNHKFTANSNLQNYDLLYGNTGLALTLENLIDNKELVTIYIGFLKSFMEKNKKIIKWRWKGNKHSGFNFGLAHGIPSIVLYLNKLLLVDPNNSDIREMIDGGVNFFLANKQDVKKIGSYFPNSIDFSVKSNNENSRLAWCYGDLGVGLAILKSGINLKNQRYKNIALEILYNCANRRGIHETKVMDLGICHGSSGLMLFFKKIYQLTNIELFREASLFWLEYTIKEIKAKGDIENVLSWKSIEYGGATLEKGFLTGISGIGLAIISTIYDTKLNWEECLLLNND